MRCSATLCLWALTATVVTAQPTPPAFLSYPPHWADSVLATLSPDERIAQLIMVAAYSNRDEAHSAEIERLVRTQKIGGLVFFQGGPGRQAALTNRYQAAANVPLLVAIDAEWGLAMRLDSTVRFPYQMTLGALPDDSLVYQMGRALARQCRRLGVHVNFAPVVDVNNNAANPVINYRSFGEDPDNVARKGVAYLRGMQDGGLLTSAKHFPGHGDTDTDSHYALPLIAHDRRRLDSLELYPFRRIIDAGAAGVMVAHLSVPQLDPAPGQASTLSRAIVTDLLQQELGFRGLIFTDAMNMKAVADHYPPGEADARALLAGNDVLEFTQDVPRAIAAVRQMVRAGQISQADIDARCRKVLLAKAWAGLDHYQPVATAGLYEALNPPAADYLNQQLFEGALTVLRNQNNLLPLRALDTLRLAAVSVGVDSTSAFQEMVARFAGATAFVLPAAPTPDQVRRLQDTLRSFDQVLLGVHVPSVRPARGYQLADATVAAVNQLVAGGRAVVCLFGNAYALPRFDLRAAPALVVTYQDHPMAQQAAAQLLFGAVPARGRLPVTPAYGPEQAAFRLHDGLDVAGLDRLHYSRPEAVGLNTTRLAHRIDSIVTGAIRARATPGAVVLVAKDGQVIFRRAYGYHTYDSLRAVRADDLYDLASVTKISASLPALMALTDAGRFDVDKTPADYLRGYRRSNKRGVTFRQILAHQGRLTAWIPFWQATVRDDGTFRRRTFRADSSARYPTRVADGLFLHRHYDRNIQRAIRRSPLLPDTAYVYSDLSFYLYPALVRCLTDQPFTDYLARTFYRPLGATTLTFNPRQRFPADRLVPTEYDSLFRKSQLHGTVHDEGAAMLGGVSGHAGLFGNADDLAKLMQMYQQGGSYGGRRYLSDSTLHAFARRQFAGNRRALGFDKPGLHPSPGGSTAQSASPASFGHSGFTGTFTWADPAYGLTYVFLSNRVNPTRNNPRLSRMNIRTNVLQAVYEELGVAPPAE